MDVNARVANNLKAIRETKHLSLEQAAKLTGVSKSMLGQIERSEVNPTISVLWKIANGLKTSFTELIEHEDGICMLEQRSIKPLVEDDGKFINYPVFPFDESTRFETYRIVLKPSGFLQAEAHIRGTVEYITVFAGEVDIMTSTEVFHLQKGDSIRFLADSAHSYRNAGQEDSELSMIIFYTR